MGEYRTTVRICMVHIRMITSVPFPLAPGMDIDENDRLMNYEKLAQQFWRDGFLMIEDYFDHRLMDEYNELIVGHFGMQPEYLHNEEFLARSGAEVIPWFPQREGVNAFDKVAQDPGLQHLTERILGPEWRALYCMVMFSGQGTKGQAWHQDCSPGDKTQFNLNRLAYTMDITEDIGGQTIVVRGSHLAGLLPASDRDESYDDEVVLLPRKGDLILLHGHAWHRVQPVTGRYRVSTNYRCVPKGVPEDVTDICVYRDMRYQFSTSEVVENRLGQL